MGEAKWRRQRVERAIKFTNPMKPARFNLLTTGTRLSITEYMCTEISWWTTEAEDLLGLVAQDTIDNDFLWIILARDKIGRFRWVKEEMNFRKQKCAEAQLRATMANILENGEIAEFSRQGDEPNSPLNPFELPPGVDRKKLNPNFKLLVEDPSLAPARKVISELALWLAPEDPHFVREFQTNGFDQRLWELFLWAALREFSLDIKQLEAPDFRCKGPTLDFTVEATTVAPSMSGVLKVHPNPKTPQEKLAFLRDYMPMKFGGALTSKLNKKNAMGLRYWEREESKEKPFVLAIADFHKPADERDLGSMTYTQSALRQYLYGMRETSHIEGDQLVIDTHAVKEHKYNNKKVPSGFFDLPDAENVSAVLFSNAGTISKFNRMGVAAGFAIPNCGYFRIGHRLKADPNALMGESFVADVHDQNYEEFWTQEIQVFHNPNAKHPLDFSAMPGAMHHFFKANEIQSMGPDGFIHSSFTMLQKHVNN